jgi:hypothetical protein
MPIHELITVVRQEVCPYDQPGACPPLTEEEKQSNVFENVFITTWKLIC